MFLGGFGLSNLSMDEPLALSRKGKPAHQVGHRGGGLQYSTASGMIDAVKRKLTEDRGLRRRLEGIEKALLNKQT